MCSRPENEIAAVTFFAKTSTALTNCSAFASQQNGRIPGTPLLIQGLQPRLHVADLCQSTMLFGIVWCCWVGNVYRIFAVLFCVGGFCLFALFWWVCFWLVFVLGLVFGGDIITAFWPVTVHF